MAERTWTRDQVLHIAADWRWTPHDAIIADTALATVVVSNGRADLHRFNCPEEMDTGALLAAVRRQAAAVDPDATLLWTVHDATVPADLPAVLVRCGAEQIDECHVLARPIDGTMPWGIGDGVTVHRIDEAALLPDAYRISLEVFGTPAPTETFRVAEAARLAEQVSAGPWRNFFRYTAYRGGDLAGAAGLTLDDGVAKLWGGGVLPAHRRHGVYGSLMAARMSQARDMGAGLALVKARVGTSSPILLRAGFTRYGLERKYAIAVR